MYFSAWQDTSRSPDQTAMQHVPLQFWQRWAELKANGFDYDFVLEAQDDDGDSIDDWLDVAHTDDFSEVAATHDLSSSAKLPMASQARRSTTQASNASKSMTHTLSPERLRRITGWSLPPTSDVGCVAEARRLKELAPRVLPMSQLMDRRGMHTLEDLDQLRQRLSRVRSTLQEADRTELSQTLDADVLWVVGLQQQAKDKPAQQGDDDDDDDDGDRDAPMFSGGGLQQHTPSIEATPQRTPSELALRHVALAKAAAVLAKAGQRHKQDGPSADFRQHFLASMQQDLGSLDWFGGGGGHP